MFVLSSCEFGRHIVVVSSCHHEDFSVEDNIIRRVKGVRASRRAMLVRYSKSQDDDSKHTHDVSVDSSVELSR